MNDWNEIAGDPGQMGVAQPSSIEAERAVLGAMLQDRESWEYGVENLTAELFYSGANAIIFEAMRVIRESGKELDQLIVNEKLRADGKLEAVGGPGYMSGLLMCVPIVENVKYYGGIVREKAMRRLAIKLSVALIDKAMNGHIDEVIETAHAIPDNLSKLSDDGKIDTRNIYPALQDRWKRIQEGGQAFIPSGFTDLDKLMSGGFPCGHTVVIKAGPGAGKSALLFQAMDQMVDRGSRALLISMEMSKDEVWSRVAGHRLYRKHKVPSGFDYSCILNTADWLRSRPELEEIAKDETGWFIDDRSSLNTDQVMSTIRHHIRTYGVNVVGIDYLNLISHRNGDVNEYENFIDRLRALSKEFGLVMFQLLQYDTATARDPKTADSPTTVRYYTTAPNAAAVVIDIRRKQEGDEAAITLQKCRFGKRGKKQYIFLGGVQTFARKDEI